MFVMFFVVAMDAAINVSLPKFNGHKRVGNNLAVPFLLVKLFSVIRIKDKKILKRLPTATADKKRARLSSSDRETYKCGVRLSRLQLLTALNCIPLREWRK